MKLNRGVPGVANVRCVTLWLFNDRLSLSAHYLPQHPPRLELSNNGGRKANECLDINAHIGTLALSATLWHIGAWSHPVRFLPDNAEMKRDHGGWGL